MTLPPFVQTLLMLAAAVFVVATFQRLRIPSSLGYLLVGMVLGPFAAGIVAGQDYLRVAAEFGIVFLLFTIGLNFSLPQIYALRHLVLGLGTAQVLFTTVAVGVLAWLAGLPPAAAFVVGAVFAQSSTTIISKQLTEQGEDQSRHGRLALAMSVFQDVTAVPFVVVIPVLGTAGAGPVTSSALAAALGIALGKALLAFVAIFLAGRWLLRPLFHVVAERRSAELFTLAVLLVSLASAWITESLGLSLAFGAFLAGMMLGETEFRHQIDSTIRPFRDVLVGLFFVTIGTLIDPRVLPDIWHLALAAAVALLVVKALVVVAIVRLARMESALAWRTGLVLAVGGEFGFALLALALGAQVIESRAAQIVLTGVLFSMIAGAFVIRFNKPIAQLLGGRRAAAGAPEQVPRPSLPATGQMREHVIVCGYGRIGQNVGRFLVEANVPYVALDLDPALVRAAHTAGEPVYYGDAADPVVLEAVGITAARLLVVSHDDVGAALRTLPQVRRLCPGLPVMVRTRDETRVDELRASGATEVVPETVEASMMIAAHALFLLGVPLPRIARRLRDVQSDRYRLLREFFHGNEALAGHTDDAHAGRLRSIRLPADAPVVGRTLAEIDFERDHVVATALLRGGKRQLNPPPETRLQGEDVLVLFGAEDDLLRVESRLLE